MKQNGSHSGTMVKRGKDIVKEFGLPVTGAIISTFAPYIGVGVAAASGVWEILDKWGAEKVAEVKKEVGEDKIIELIQRDRKSRDILYKLLKNVFEEQSEEKRKMFYNYIRNIHKNIHPQYNYHSKIVMIINAVEFDELSLLFSLAERYEKIVGFAVEGDRKENPTAKISTNINRGISVKDIQESKLITVTDRDQLEEKLVSLGNYGLVAVKNGRYGGTFFGPITEFGRVFIDFINETEDD